MERKAYAHVLGLNKKNIHLSLSRIDGTHTPAMRGGECVEYQSRKKRWNDNALFFIDNQGIPLAISAPQAGNNADLYEIEEKIDYIAEQIKDARIPLDGFSATLTQISTVGISVRHLTPMESSPTYVHQQERRGR